MRRHPDPLVRRPFEWAVEAMKTLVFWACLVFALLLAVVLAASADVPVITNGAFFASTATVLQNNLYGNSTCSLNVPAGLTGTLTVNLSSDAIVSPATATFPIPVTGTTVLGTVGLSAGTATLAGAAANYTFSTAGYAAIRVGLSAYTSGNVFVSYTCTQGGGGGGTASGTVAVSNFPSPVPTQNVYVTNGTVAATPDPGATNTLATVSFNKVLNAAGTGYVNWPVSGAGYPETSLCDVTTGGRCVSVDRPNILYVETAGNSNGACAAATLCSVSTNQGFITGVIITATGTAAVPIVDSSQTTGANTGTVICGLPATTTLFQIIPCNAHVNNGIYAAAVAGGPAYTVFYAK